MSIDTLNNAIITNNNAYSKKQIIINSFIEKQNQLDEAKQIAIANAIANAQQQIIKTEDYVNTIKAEIVAKKIEMFYTLNTIDAKETRALLKSTIEEYEAFRSFLYNNNGNGRTIEYIKFLIMAKYAIEKRVRDLINSLKLGLDN